MLRADHVVIVIFGEGHAHAIAGLRRAAMPDIVGQDDIIFASVERLAGAEQFARKLWLKELLAGAAGAVEDHHRIGDLTACVAPGGAERRVVNFEFGQFFASCERKILEDRITFNGVGWLGVSGRDAGKQQGERGENLVHGRTLTCRRARSSYCPYPGVPASLTASRAAANSAPALASHSRCS